MKKIIFRLLTSVVLILITGFISSLRVGLVSEFFFLFHFIPFMFGTHENTEIAIIIYYLILWFIFYQIIKYFQK